MGLLKIALVASCLVIMVTAQRPGEGRNAFCEEPIVSGPCEAYIPSVGFNQETGKCEEFIYGGCQGNSNRFPSFKQCEAACMMIDDTTTAIWSASTTAAMDDLCTKPIEVGSCKAILEAYGFNGTHCVRFDYGGCLGNANNFQSMADCRAKCGGPN